MVQETPLHLYVWSRCFTSELRVSFRACCYYSNSTFAILKLPFEVTSKKPWMLTLPTKPCLLHNVQLLHNEQLYELNAHPLPCLVRAEQLQPACSLLKGISETEKGGLHQGNSNKSLNLVKLCPGFSRDTLNFSSS